MDAAGTGLGSDIITEDDKAFVGHEGMLGREALRDLPCRFGQWCSFKPAGGDEAGKILGDDVAVALVGNGGVSDLRMDGDGEARRERPGSGTK